MIFEEEVVMKMARYFPLILFFVCFFAITQALELRISGDNYIPDTNEAITYSSSKVLCGSTSLLPASCEVSRNDYGLIIPNQNFHEKQVNEKFSQLKEKNSRMSEFSTYSL